MTAERGLWVNVRGERHARDARFVYQFGFDFEPGINVLFGPSAAGKTTILSCIAGLMSPRAGEIVLAGRTLFDAGAKVDVSPHERRVALVFQSLALFPHFDALGNVEYGVPRSVPRSERRERAQAWLERMHVGHLRSRRAASFSGGEAQRVALARALASEPRALLLDEPFSALDRALAEELAAELVTQLKSVPIPVVLVTHDRSLARRLGQRVALVQDGKVTAIGPADDLLVEPQPARYPAENANGRPAGK